MLRRKSGSVTGIGCILSYPCLVSKVYMKDVSELETFLGKYATFLVPYTESEPLLVKLG